MSRARDYLLNGSAEPCSLGAESALADEFCGAELPGAVAKGELSLALESEAGLDSDTIEAEIDCEDTVQVLVVDSPAAPFTTAKISGELRAVESIETDCVLSSCQR